MYRNRKVQKSYTQYLKQKPAGCDFCKLQKDTHAQVVRECRNFWIISNIFKYETWDNLNVLDHLMIVPKEHVVTLSKLPKDSLEEYVNLLKEYEPQGYSIYARSSSNLIKTVPHQHTHLLKLGDRRTKIQIFLQSPYIFWTR